MLKLRPFLVLFLILATLAAPQLWAQDAAPNAEERVKAALQKVDPLIARLDANALEVFNALENAYTTKRDLPAMPEDVKALSAEEADTLLDAYSGYKKQLLVAYDAISNEKENPKADQSLFALALEAKALHASLLLTNGESVPQELSKQRGAAVDKLVPYVKRFFWADPLMNGLAEENFLTRTGYSGKRSTNSVLLPNALINSVSKESAGSPIEISISVWMLAYIQQAIDPIEDNISAIQEQVNELDQQQFAALEANQKAPEDAVDEFEADHRRTEVRIDRYRAYRAKMLDDFEKNYFLLAMKARRLGEEVSLENLLEELPETTQLQRQQLQNRIESAQNDLGQAERKALMQLLEEVEASYIAIKAQGDGIDHQESLEKEIPDAIAFAKDLRIKAIRDELRTQRSRFQVLRNSAQREIASLINVDERLEKLNKRLWDERLKFYGFAALWALAILFAAWVLIRIVKMIAKRIVRRFNAELDHIDQDTEARAKTISVAFTGTMSAAIWVVAMLMVLGHFGINYQPLLVATGGIGLAIGFGAQSLVKDFFAGFFILLENQFTVGDVITIAGKTGTVEEINLRTTRMRSLDGTYHTVPNGQIDSVSNMTHKWSRMLVVIGAGYREDPDHVRAVINKVGKEMFEDDDWKDRLLEPPVVLGLDNLNASSIDFKVVGRTRSGDQWAAEREFRRRVKIQFDIEDIEIPFQYVNYVQAEPEASRVLKAASPSLRQKLVESDNTEVPDEGAAKREKNREREEEESESSEEDQESKKSDA